VAVFDADFVAAPGFLSSMVVLLHDPSVAVVQTTQRFSIPIRSKWTSTGLDGSQTSQAGADAGVEAMNLF
jgi:cellulose synthase/poly-beta-1,6-N-acetylglucosamine synthase-like glycosyltransferase